MPHVLLAGRFALLVFLLHRCHANGAFEVPRDNQVTQAALAPVGNGTGETAENDVVAMTMVRDALTTYKTQRARLRWISGSDPCGAAFCNGTCNWRGITCRGWRITGITLDGAPLQDGSNEAVSGGDGSAQLLSGALPDALSRLDALDSLSLPNHRIRGTLPAALGHLNALTWLDLSGNRLSGGLPLQWAGMHSLNVMNLADNLLQGAVPREWLFLTNLTLLNISGNSNICAWPLLLHVEVFADGAAASCPEDPIMGLPAISDPPPPAGGPAPAAGGVGPAADAAAGLGSQGLPSNISMSASLATAFMVLLLIFFGFLHKRKQDAMQQVMVRMASDREAIQFYRPQWGSPRGPPPPPYGPGVGPGAQGGEGTAPPPVVVLSPDGKMLYYAVKLPGSAPSDSPEDSPSCKGSGGPFHESRCSPRGSFGDGGEGPCPSRGSMGSPSRTSSPSVHATRRLSSFSLPSRPGPSSPRPALPGSGYARKMAERWKAATTPRVDPPKVDVNPRRVDTPRVDAAFGGEPPAHESPRVYPTLVSRSSVDGEGKPFGFGPWGRDCGLRSTGDGSAGPPPTLGLRGVGEGRRGEGACDMGFLGSRGDARRHRDSQGESPERGRVSEEVLPRGATTPGRLQRGVERMRSTSAGCAGDAGLGRGRENPNSSVEVDGTQHSRLAVVPGRTGDEYLSGDGGSDEMANPRRHGMQQHVGLDGQPMVTGNPRNASRLSEGVYTQQLQDDVGREPLPDTKRQRPRRLRSQGDEGEVLGSAPLSGSGHLQAPGIDQSVRQSSGDSGQGFAAPSHSNHGGSVGHSRGSAEGQLEIAGGARPARDHTERSQRMGGGAPEPVCNPGSPSFASGAALSGSGTVRTPSQGRGGAQEGRTRRGTERDFQGFARPEEIPRGFARRAARPRSWEASSTHWRILLPHFSGPPRHTRHLSYFSEAAEEAMRRERWQREAAASLPFYVARLSETGDGILDFAPGFPSPDPPQSDAPTLSSPPTDSQGLPAPPNPTLTSSPVASASASLAGPLLEGPAGRSSETALRGAEIQADEV